jgi:putative integral membrane protein (TIGR02587 family)
VTTARPSRPAPAQPPPTRARNLQFARGLARAYGGAIVFTLPLLMTMEMWSIGAYLPAWKLMLLVVLFFPFLVALSWHAGFEATFDWRDDVVDALVAYAVGFSAALLLGMLGQIDAGMSMREIGGKLVLQALPGSVGALLAQSQFGQDDAGDLATRGGTSSYASELFVMASGAVFLAFNLAPTQEMLIIALRVTTWNAALLVLLSVAVMHAFVYAAGFRGSPQATRGTGAVSLFLRFTVAGWVLAALLSAFMLWTFGRFDGMGLLACAKVTVVLGFPAGVGAAAARLILGVS